MMVVLKRKDIKYFGLSVYKIISINHGKPHGPTITIFDNRIHKEIYKNGEKISEFVYRMGRLHYRISYRNGEKNGDEVYYDLNYDSRIVRKIIPYKNGKKNGNIIEYYDEGFLSRYVATYENGILRSETIFGNNDNILSSVNYKKRSRK